MLMTCHVLAGAAIGRLARRPLIACPTALASHLALDATPHADASTFFTAPGGGFDLAGLPFVLADVVVGIALLLWLTRGSRDRTLLLTCAGLAALTDLVHYAPLVGEWFEHCPLTGWWASLHGELQNNTGRAGAGLGFATQAALVAGCLAVLTRVPAGTAPAEPDQPDGR
jgi:hypothetical protein